MQEIIDSIYKFKPSCEQELRDKELILKEISKKQDQILYRTSELFHITTSAFVMNKKCDKFLLVHHNIYNSWAFIGGHADGMSDLLLVARKEIEEESGAIHIKEISKNIISIDILTTKAHYHKNKFVPSHLHFNLSYLFLVEEEDKIRIKPDENTAVSWVKISEIDQYVSDIEMQNLFHKIQKNIRY